MKYKPSPLNIVCTLTAIWAIYLAIKHGDRNWNAAITIFLTYFTIIGFVIDFLLQRFIRTRYVVVIETVLMVVGLVWMFMHAA